MFSFPVFLISKCNIDPPRTAITKTNHLIFTMSDSVKYRHVLKVLVLTNDQTGYTA